MTIDHEAGEISLFEAVDHVFAWRWLFPLSVILGTATMAVFSALLTPTDRENISTTTYPAMPGMASGTVAAVLRDRSAQANPSISASRRAPLWGALLGSAFGGIIVAQ